MLHLSWVALNWIMFLFFISFMIICTLFHIFVLFIAKMWLFICFMSILVFIFYFFHLDFGVHFPLTFFFHFLVHLDSGFHVFIYMFVLSNMFILSFGFWICVSCSLCPSVALCCLVFVSCLCLQLHSNGFFSKVPHFLSIHFGWGAKQTLPINQIHAMKPYENPNENPSENPNENPNENPFWQWTKTLILFKTCKWKWQNENIVFF